MENPLFICSSITVKIPGYGEVFVTQINRDVLKYRLRLHNTAHVHCSASFYRTTNSQIQKGSCGGGEEDSRPSSLDHQEAEEDPLATRMIMHKKKTCDPEIEQLKGPGLERGSAAVGRAETPLSPSAAFAYCLAPCS